MAWTPLAVRLATTPPARARNGRYLRQTAQTS